MTFQFVIIVWPGQWLHWQTTTS